CRTAYTFETYWEKTPHEFPAQLKRIQEMVDIDILQIQVQGLMNRLLPFARETQQGGRDRAGAGMKGSSGLSLNAPTTLVSRGQQSPATYPGGREWGEAVGRDSRRHLRKGDGSQHWEEQDSSSAGLLPKPSKAHSDASAGCGLAGAGEQHSRQR
ncbi:hypothetical protein EK904_010187, partial [Melospiza melodia maxima]